MLCQCYALFHHNLPLDLECEGNHVSCEPPEAKLNILRDITRRSLLGAAQRKQSAFIISISEQRLISLVNC